MKFDKLVNSILNESVNRLPILDGNREAYVMGVPLYTLKTDPEATRLEEGALEMWDDNYADISDGELIGTFNDFATALKTLDDICASLYDELDLFPHNETGPCSLPDSTKQIITEKIGHLIGKWKVINTHQPDSENWTGVELLIGVDVDLVHYRTGGLRDAVKTAIDDTDDISDW